MSKTFHNQGLYFESKTTTTKKIFTIKFPSDIHLALRWTPKELKKLQSLDSSTEVSDQLTMLAMMAKKVEDRSEGDETTKEITRE